MKFTIALQLLLLLLAYDSPCYARQQVSVAATQRSGVGRSLLQQIVSTDLPPGVVTITDSASFIAALQNDTVIGMRIFSDLVLPQSAWAQLTDNIPVNRNLTIFGGSGQYDNYPAINTGWLNSAHGISLGPNVVLTLAHVMLKRTRYFLPDFVYQADPSALVVLYDTLHHLYTGAPTAVAMSVLIHGDRPAWAPPGDNNAILLPNGICRSGPSPPMCWGTAYTLVHLAQESLSGNKSSGAFVRSLIYATSVVYEKELTGVCLQQYYSGNVTCLNTTSFNLQAQESATASGWLQQPATPDQIASIMSTVDIPYEDVPYIPSWAGRVLNDQGSSVDGSKDNSTAARIGIAVGVSVGVLAILAALLGFLWFRRSKQRALALQNSKPLSVPMPSAPQSYPVIDIEHGLLNDRIPPAVDGAEHSGTTRAMIRSVEELQLAMKVTGSSAGYSSDHRMIIEGVNYDKGSKKQEMSGNASHSSDDEGPDVGALNEGLCLNGQDLANHPVFDPIATASNTTAGSHMYALEHTLYSNLANLSEDPSLFRLKDIITGSSPVMPTINLHVDMERDVELGVKLGTGAMGSVYKAAYRNQEVAVKVFAEGADLSSFAHEISILGRTRHPHVVGLLGACFSVNHVALIEELCDGSLEQLMYETGQGNSNHQPQQESSASPPNSANTVAALPETAPQKPPVRSDNSIAPHSLPDVPKPLPLQMIISIAMEVASGLAYLHPTVIHRDLKPANILLVKKPGSTVNHTSSKNGNTSAPTSTAASASSTSSSSQPGSSSGSVVTATSHQPTYKLSVKLSDFGLSRMRDAMTIVTQRPYCGTVPYMAPECFNKQWQNGLTHKCDIYSFGMCLWEMLHGVRPWYGYAPAEVLYEVAVKNTRPPILLPEERCPRQLRKLLVRCWDRDPHRRPPALEIVRELAFLQRRLNQAQNAQPSAQPGSTTASSTTTTTTTATTNTTAESSKQPTGSLERQQIPEETAENEQQQQQHLEAAAAPQ